MSAGLETESSAPSEAEINKAGLVSWVCKDADSTELKGVYPANRGSSNDVFNFVATW